MIRIPFGPTSALATVVLAGIFTGCATTYKASPTEPYTRLTSLPVDVPPPSRENPYPLPDTLTLSDAIALALTYNPSIRSAAFELQGREFDAYQAGRPPNPELETGIEEFGGSGSRSGTASFEGGAGLSQKLELGGDRRARADVAARDADLAAWDVTSIRLDVETEVRLAFKAVLVAKARLALAEEQAEIARRLADTVERRAVEGAVSPLEARRAEIASITASTILERSRQNEYSARARLAATFRGDASSLIVKGEFTTLGRVPELDKLAPLLVLNPDLAEYSTSLEKARAQKRLERARRIPDPTIRVGAAYFNDFGETGVTSGISIPLPFLDTNRGAIKAAEARISATEADGEAALLRAELALTTLHGSLLVSMDAARRLRDDALPKARTAYEGILIGYQEGEYGLLNVLDAQSALIQTQNAYIDAVADYHHARALVERLIATPFQAVEDVLQNQK